MYKINSLRLADNSIGQLDGINIWIWRIIFVQCLNYIAHTCINVLRYRRVTKWHLISGISIVCKYMYLRRMPFSLYNYFQIQNRILLIRRHSTIRERYTWVTEQQSRIQRWNSLNWFRSVGGVETRVRRPLFNPIVVPLLRLIIRLVKYTAFGAEALEEAGARHFDRSCEPTRYRVVNAVFILSRPYRDCASFVDGRNVCPSR